MKKVELYIPEVGDSMIITKDVRLAGLNKGQILRYVAHIQLGVVCVYEGTQTQVLIPYDSIEGLYEGKQVKVTFQ